MANAHSYRITLSNNKTEKEALNLVLSARSDILIPDSKGRRAILSALEVEQRFSRAFDLVRIEGHTRGESQVEILDPTALTLFEIKSTKKLLPDFPRGFFLGATKNEFDLAERLGERFAFCFVSLHPDQQAAKRITYLSLAALRPLIRTQRTQYQVNL